jgi:hypothetical protein
VRGDGGCVVIPFDLDGFRGSVTPAVLNVMDLLSERGTVQEFK